MNTTWQGITQLINSGLSIRGQNFLAQAPINEGITEVQGIVQQVVAFTPRLLGAAVLLLVGWLIALAVAAFTKGVLNRTKLDNRIAAGITGREDIPQLEKLISGLVFWSIMLLTIVAVLQTLELEVASRPLNNLLDQLIGFLPKLVGAGILLGVAWLIATIVKLVTILGIKNPAPHTSHTSHTSHTPQLYHLLIVTFCCNSSLIRLRIELSSKLSKMRLITAFGPSAPQVAPLAK